MVYPIKNTGRTHSSEGRMARSARLLFLSRSLDIAPVVPSTGCDEIPTPQRLSWGLSWLGLTILYILDNARLTHTRLTTC